LLIIKDRIFTDVNTGSHLGGRGKKESGSTKNSEKQQLYPLADRRSRCSPTYFLPENPAARISSLVLVNMRPVSARAKKLPNKFYFFA
jgi:hypothetical protein